MSQDDAFDRVIEQVMPLIYGHLRDEAVDAGLARRQPSLERFVSHERYQRAHESLVALLARIEADALMAEFVLTRLLPEHRPALH
jgi:hypothetical protein